MSDMTVFVLAFVAEGRARTPSPIFGLASDKNHDHLMTVELAVG